ncbi:hypothetical protein PTE30175_04229 [Pandoraea terrae]|uniref:Polysaccharide chain length determinant N-terminal domain-containing protein n=1 Tax=Pandoraea terrae TaxID=1537710 RepID=A0A5E4Y820_9BURK|nr:hypothetical protein [Pandoraea terrae]VVE44493.1 hypothetical protein PTE30175_04229 [Pandoraea terrae]
MLNSAAIAPSDDVGLDFLTVLHCLQRNYKRFVAVAIVLTLALFCGIFAVQCKYVSDGFLHAPRSVVEYNAQKSAFSDKNLLRRYLEARRLIENADGKYLLEALDGAFFQKHVRFEMPYTKDDLRYLDDKTPGDVKSLGFAISFDSKSSPQDAQARVSLMGDFIKDTMLQQDLLELIHANALDAKSRRQQLDNKLIRKTLSLTEANSKLVAIRAIAARYPDASRMGERQLLSTTSEGARYLSPTAQLVGLESDIADIKTSRDQLNRDMAQNALLLDFYSRLDVLIERPATGAELLAAFQATIKDVFKDQELSDDKAREVYNQLLLIANRMQAKHVDDPRFVSGPTLPLHRSGPGPVLLALVSLVIGALFSALIILLSDSLKQLEVADVAAER